VACATLVVALLAAGSALAARNDFNRDGHSDLLWHNQATGELYVWYLNGVVSFGGGYLTPSRVGDLRWQVRGIADFNGDGWVDLLWHHQATGELYVWYLNGLSTVGAGFLNPRAMADTRWQVRGVADLNGDAKPDLLWQNTQTGDVHAWFLSGGAVFGGGPVGRSADPNWQVRGLADFSGDAKTDVIWHNQVSGDLYVWCLEQTTVTLGAFLRPRMWDDLNWRVASVADFSPDGKIDLLWRNNLFGYLYVWYLNGVMSGPGEYLTPMVFSDRNWQVAPR
jgi:hypothetical protein